MAQTLGQKFQASAKLQQLIEQSVQEAMTFSQQVEGVRDALPDQEGTLKSAIETTNALRGRPLFYDYIGSGVGRGPYVELEDGSVKLDLINGIGIHIMGHNHPKVMAATVKGALADVVMQGHLQPNKEYRDLSQRLARLASKNSRLKHVWLSTCGTIANENALKMCRQKKSPARMIISFQNEFAGRSTMMAEITDNPAYKVGLPNYNEVLRVPFYDKNNPEKTLMAFKEHVAKHENNISCFVFEPMLGEGGYRSAPKEFFIPILEFCKSKGIPVWADEIQTFTRTGNFFAFETCGFAEYVDVCTIAKTAQTGATLYTEEFNPQPGLIAGTFAGSTAALAAGNEILRILEEEGYMGPEGKVQKIHNEFVGMLNELNETTCKGLLREAGGLGLMVAVTPLDGSKDKQLALLKKLFKNNLIAFGCGHDPYRLRFLIPAVITSADIQVAKKIIEKSILELA